MLWTRRRRPNVRGNTTDVASSCVWCEPHGRYVSHLALGSLWNANQRRCMSHPGVACRYAVDAFARYSGTSSSSSRGLADQWRNQRWQCSVLWAPHFGSHFYYIHLYFTNNGSNKHLKNHEHRHTHTNTRYTNTSNYTPKLSHVVKQYTPCFIKTVPFYFCV